MTRLWLIAAVAAVGCAHQNAPAPTAHEHAEHAHEHAHVAAAASTPAEKLLPGLGEHHRAISTENADAQRYFDQGLRLTYAFNHDEAQRSFEEAARRDPSCAICYWGAAMVLGPNINLPTDATRVKAAMALVAKAKAAPHASPVERALIGALEQRYADPPAATPEAQAKYDRAYADAMREVAKQYPSDDDVQVLFAESLMDLNPWKLWQPDGKPAPGTEEITKTLEVVLARNPQHPGANHYYIHAVEASPHPERALAAAGRVAGLMPGAGHIVHMPSHIYERVGRYADAAEANKRAIVADQRYLALGPNLNFYAMYVGHNYQFLWAAAMMAGRGDEAVKAARDMVATLPLEMLKQMPEMAFIMAAPSLALVRFGRWQEVLKEPAPAAELPLWRVMHTYAQARAHAALGQYDAAEKDVAALDTLLAATPKDAKAAMYQPAPVYVGIARDVAAGDLSCRRGKTAEGLARLRAAVAAEDTLSYDEPPDWYYPTRHTLGACLMRAHKAKEAEAVYREDLKRNPDNGWALTGLRESLRAQNKKSADVDAKLAKAFPTAPSVAVTDY